MERMLSFHNLCEEATNKDPWLSPYKIMSRKKNKPRTTATMQRSVGS